MLMTLIFQGLEEFRERISNGWKNGVSLPGLNQKSPIKIQK
jgi:hypothetical protein